MTDPVPVHFSVATTDPDVTDNSLRQTYAGAEISVPQDNPSFEYRQDVHGDSDLSLGRFRLGGHGRVRLELEDTVTVVRRRTGTHDWELDGRRGTGLMVIQPHQSYRAVLHLLTVDSVNFSLSSLWRTAHALDDDDAPGIGFDRPRPVAPAMEEYWNATHDFLHVAMNDPEIASSPLLRADLSRRIAVATLMAFPRTRDRRGHRRESVAARQAAYRKAVEFMHGALAQPITVEDVARHVRLSTTELTRAFRAHRGTTPGNYLRELRLAAAHDELAHADPSGGDTVRAVALRWAFADPGDFVRRYRAAYGETPGRTLRS